MILETDYLSPAKQRHFKMIEDYNTLMSMPNASQKAVFATLLNKYRMFYKSYNSVKQTFARLMKEHPEKFTNN